MGIVVDISITNILIAMVIFFAVVVTMTFFASDLKTLVTVNIFVTVII
jgi:hypothetical protein